MANQAHESAVLHVSGEAIYIDDIPLSDKALVGYVVYSKIAHAKIKSYDLSAAKVLGGVHAILTYKDIPGDNQMGPIIHDEPVLAIDEVTFIGQAIFIIAAESEEIAKEAEKRIQIEFEELTAITSIEQAMADGELIQPARLIQRGDVEKGLAESEHVFEDQIEIGGQEHWYLETQTCLAVPGEGNDMTAYSSTQNPAETQAIIAEVLGLSKMEVEVQTRRMGGAFGGKETQANHVASWACVLARYTKRPVKIRLFRDDDQIMTGKRHRMIIKYKAGFNSDGKIQAVAFEQNCDAGAAVDLTMAVLERAMMHADNSYWIPNIKIIGNAWKTNITSNTAYRGFGGPQGVAGIEEVIDRIARFLKKDAFDIRVKNFYGMDDHNVTPYFQTVENNRLFMIKDQILASSDYEKRRKEVDAFNASNEFYKKGLALTPIKFGISFTTSFLNQAGALVNIYKDGTVLINHGGTEMGQGLNTKIQQIAALELGIDIEKTKVNATNTSKVPNTSATAASAGTDLNGAAVKNACDKLKDRLAQLAVELFNVEYAEEDPSVVENIMFYQGQVVDTIYPDRSFEFADLCLKANFNQVSLSATGFYKTPDVHFDREKGQGKPYHYFSFGMACSEVKIDTLTGHVNIERTDIVHDVGDSILTNIDIGQIEGAFVQGVGWCTTEECKWDDKGKLLNHSPDTYKIPGIQDIPDVFNVALLENAPNLNTIRRSKAVGEPPFMLCFSVWLAIKDAISAVANHEKEPKIQIPMTNEAILLSLEELKG